MLSVDIKSRDQQFNMTRKSYLKEYIINQHMRTMPSEITLNKVNDG